MSWSALLLAGNRRAACPVAAPAGVSHKALIPIGGRTMIERVIDALRALPEIASVTILVEDPDLLAPIAGLAPLREEGYLRLLEAAPSPSLSATKGVEALGGGASPVLMATADIPLITPAMLRHFLAHQPPGADAVAALAKSALVSERYPDAIRTTLKFADAPRSGCNLFAFHTPRALNVLRFWRRIEENRKNPLRMLRQLGLAPALRYATGRLTLDSALKTLGTRTGTTLGVVDMPFAEAAIDVDKPADLGLVERILATRETA